MLHIQTFDKPGVTSGNRCFHAVIRQLASLAQPRCLGTVCLPASPQAEKPMFAITVSPFSLRGQAATLALGVLFCLLSAGCSDKNAKLAGTCGECHTTVLDANHQLSCTVCHHGNSGTREKSEAHVALLARPAHPGSFAITCGTCHALQTKTVPEAGHFTLHNAINLTRSAFGASEKIPSLQDIPLSAEPENIGQLADDMLRRRCLRCHLFSPGDDYAATRRGTGCAACHLEYKGGRLVSHVFSPQPSDDRCLSCHYSNRVGFDYYGRFEHDFNVEYRTPYSAAASTDRPYGVEYHELSPDVHQQRGMICVDCHRGELMQAPAQGQAIGCADCHDSKVLQIQLPVDVTLVDGQYRLRSRGDNRDHPLPLMRDMAHAENPEVSCQACHAQWGFNDSTTHLLRSDLDEYEDWARLTVQGSSALEALLENNLDFDNEELPPVSIDQITGEQRPGLWYMGFAMRRWENVSLGRDENGRISVMRPMLRLALSWVDTEGNIRFNNASSTAANDGWLPYTPHTTGPAGLFYRERLRLFRAQEATSHSSGKKK